MRIAYFDCFSGISGDMMLGALLDAGLPLDALRAELSKVPLSGYTLDVQRVTHQGITGTQVVVLDRSQTFHSNGNGHGLEQEADHQRNAADLAQILNRSVVSEDIKRKAISVISLLAKAEATVNCVDVGRVNLNQLAGAATLTDVVGVIVGLSLMGIERVECSPINVGGGFVRAADGVMPVPAPITAEILRQGSVPLYGTDANKELVTPAGAAIIVTLAGAFGPIPSIAMEKVGYGAGKSDAPRTSGFLRVTIGDLVARPAIAVPEQPEVALTAVRGEDPIARIEANLDDLSPQQCDFVMERLLGHGALNAFLVPVQMRNNQPGMLLSALCKPELVDILTALIFEETSAPEVRITNMPRRTLRQDVAQVETTYGPIKVTVARDADGKVLHVKPEYDDVKKAALEQNVGMDLVNEEARNAWGPYLADTHQQIGRQRTIPAGNFNSGDYSPAAQVLEN